MSDIFDSLREKGVFVSSVTRKTNSDVETLCLDFSKKVVMRTVQESYGDRTYYAIPAYWQEVYTHTNVIGRGFVAESLNDEQINTLRNEVFAAHRQPGFPLFGYSDWCGFLATCAIVSTYYSIGD